MMQILVIQLLVKWLMGVDCLEISAWLRREDNLSRKLFPRTKTE